VPVPSFIPNVMHINFDLNQNPIDMLAEFETVDAQGNASNQELRYIFTAGDITNINSVITNARAAWGV